MISTDRTSLDWKHNKTAQLRDFLGAVVRAIGQDWRIKRKEKKEKERQEKSKIDEQDWKDKLPSKERKSVDAILEQLEKSELTGSEQAKVINALHDIVPEYNVKKDYLSAAIEAVKVFEDKVQEKTGLHSIDGKGLIDKAFGSNKSILLLTDNSTQTEKNLEDGLSHLSCGVWTGFRNPVQHELRTSLYPDIFTDKDALDLMSLISYLLKKVEQTKKRSKAVSPSSS